jgi:type IV secretory pathway component VirB8
MMDSSEVQLSPQAVSFFAENVDRETSDREKLENSKKGWTAFAIAGWSIAVVAIAAIIPLCTLHEFIPATIIVDRVSGDYQVRIGKERVDVGDKKNEQRMISDIGRFVKAREGFSRAEAEANYKTVYYSLLSTLRDAWDAEYLSTNPRALINTMSAFDQLRIVNPSITWLPSTDADKKIRVAQYRFEKERRLQGRAHTVQAYVATLSYTYDSSNVPADVDGLIYNAFGFTVINYRADPQGPEHEIQEAAKGGQQ